MSYCTNNFFDEIVRSARWEAAEEYASGDCALARRLTFADEHGDKGDGKTFAANVLNPPPKNFTLEKSKKELTEKRMIESITEGRKGTAMMPWKSRLSQQEIQAVVNYIRKKLY